ncbi:hypothetical protein [Vibrio sagamiensis]|uniref:Uncharacterized protein n=1 Tax=Vibrio sagamiensis NBRC 104589 TaxID=1219064 RepID=A0A511QIY5_9VIBR|nr:hypothetical protein [Vibrio sagamiensis]PNQ53950.1 hypothetical protein C1141_18495 [Vibrio agarivorans]GEM77147.1 hypothetical protein VSA01S_32590 [Vibrio sagamiensis NBRC 104589]
MKTHKKRHQKLLHHCLTQRVLCPTSFSILTNLTDEECQRWLSSNLGEVRHIVTTLGLMLEYQRYRETKNSLAFIQVRRVLTQNLYLWSDAMGAQNIPPEFDTQQLGLMLLAEYDNRLAVLWSIRLKMKIPSTTITVRSKLRLCGAVNQVLTPLLNKSGIN